MARNPEVQEKLYNESLSLLPNKHSPVNKETLTQCPYTRAALKETFRLNPISVGVGRILDTDAMFSGYCVPKGVSIHILLLKYILIIYYVLSLHRTTFTNFLNYYKIFIFN